MLQLFLFLHYNVHCMTPSFPTILKSQKHFQATTQELWHHSTVLITEAVCGSKRHSAAAFLLCFWLVVSCEHLSWNGSVSRTAVQRLVHAVLCSLQYIQRTQLLVSGNYDSKSIGPELQNLFCMLPTVVFTQGPIVDIVERGIFVGA